MRITKNITEEFIDERGGIAKVLDDGATAIKSILRITSKKGAIRSNHYHKKDSHYCYLESGALEYYERPVNGRKIKKAVLAKGDMVFTPPLMVHGMKFLEDSVLWAFATRSRDQKDYEKDTVRIALIS
ncbi:MAG: hypothetical protein Q8R17_00600 [bacterium]|nr:hypothetical protein [bacterium]